MRPSSLVDGPPSSATVSTVPAAFVRSSERRGRRRHLLRPRFVALEALVRAGRDVFSLNVESRDEATLRRLRAGNYVAVGAYSGVLPKIEVSLRDDDEVVRAIRHDGRRMSPAEAQAEARALIFECVKDEPDSQLATTIRRHFALRAAQHAQRKSLVRTGRRVSTRPTVRRAQPRRRRAARRAARPTARAPDPDPPRSSGRRRARRRPSRPSSGVPP